MSPVKSPEEPSARDTIKKDKIVVEKGEAEELPPGWIKEVKVRKAGSATKADRFYTDPVTGYIFRSFKDVQRYLKTGEVGRLAIKPKNNDSVNTDNKDENLHVCGSNGSKTRSRSSETDRSPHRASKRLAAINIDSSLSPPSTPEAKTRQATRLAGVVVDASLPSPSPPPPEPKTRQATQLAGVAVDESLPSSSPPVPPEPKTRQATRLAGIKVDTSPSAPEPKTRPPTRLAPPEPKTRQTTRQAGIKVDSPPPSPPPDIRASRQATQKAGTKIDAPSPSPFPSPAAPKTRQAASPPASKIHQPTQLTEMEIVASPPSLPEPKTRQAKRALGIRDDSSAAASPPEPKTRRATRQAGIKINPPPPSPPDTRTSRQATARPVNNNKAEVEKIRDKHNENADMDENSNDKQETSTIIPPVNQDSQEKVKKDEFNPDEKPKHHNILPPVTPKENYKEIETGPVSIPPPKVQSPPTVSPPVNLGKQESPVFNPTLTNPIPQVGFGYDNIKPESSINFSMTDLWTDPCIEFAVKTLTGAIPFADLNKVDSFSPSPLEVPLTDLWTDPCIEFAVKTLTGAIPVGESDYLQQQRPASSSNPRAQHDFSLPDMGMSFCQTEVLSKHYETGQNKQQESVIPTLGNGVNGSNGQCSRSRFFQ